MGYSKRRESLEARKEPPVRQHRNVDEREKNDASYSQRNLRDGRMGFRRKDAPEQEGLKSFIPMRLRG